jgi:excisionase family DNA binding protein
MQNLTFTPLSDTDIRAAIRDELESFFAEHALNAPQPETDQIGGINLACEVTGLARPTIYGLVSQSKIPHMKWGKLLYFSRQELTDWIKQGRRKTVSDAEREAEQYVSNKRKRG